MTNKLTSLTLALALGTLAQGVSGIALAQQALTEPQVHDKLTAEGYTKVHDLKFKQGMWYTKAKSANGDRVDLRIDAKSGEIYPDEQVSRLSEQDVRAALGTQGYTHVHDLDFRDGMWEAKADNASGNHVRLKVDPHSGKVIGID